MRQPREFWRNFARLPCLTGAKNLWKVFQRLPWPEHYRRPGTYSARAFIAIGCATCCYISRQYPNFQRWRRFVIMSSEGDLHSGNRHGEYEAQLVIRCRALYDTSNSQYLGYCD